MLHRFYSSDADGSARQTEAKQSKGISRHRLNYGHVSVLCPSNWVFSKSLCTARVCLVVVLSCVRIRVLSDYAAHSKRNSVQFAPMRKMPTYL